MDYKNTLSSLFFLLIQADGNVSENEMMRGKQMLEAEGIDEAKFNLLLEKLKAQERESIFKDCVNAVKKTKH